jgi:excisionase family DNA binding protein
MTSVPATTSPDRLWSISELKRFTSLSETGIRRLVRQGVLPTVRIGRRILFRPSSIARFIKQRETGGDTPARRGRRPGRQQSLALKTKNAGCKRHSGD